MLSWEWRCSWSSADRRCSSYIWVINNFIAYLGATYIRGFTIIFCCTQEAWGGGHKANFLCSDIFPNFQIYQNTGYLLNIMFIFGRCHCSLAAQTSVKYGCGLKNLTCTFAGSKISLMEKLTNRTLIKPTPGACTDFCFYWSRRSPLLLYLCCLHFISMLSIFLWYSETCL